MVIATGAYLFNLMNNFFNLALQDYRPILETLKFNNESSLCVEIFAIPDLETENNEYFTLWLSSNDSVQLDPQFVNVTITNLGM